MTLFTKVEIVEKLVVEILERSSYEINRTV